jgi:hypothetical protein
MEIHCRGRITPTKRQEDDDMFGFLQKLIICMAAGTLLSLVFLTPTGAVVGAINGLIVGVCVGLGELRAKQTEASVGSTGPIRLVGGV